MNAEVAKTVGVTAIACVGISCYTLLYSQAYEIEHYKSRARQLKYEKYLLEQKLKSLQLDPCQSSSDSSP